MWRVVGFVVVGSTTYRFEIARYRWRFWAHLRRWWLDVGHFHKIDVERIEDGRS